MMKERTIFFRYTLGSPLRIFAAFIFYIKLFFFALRRRFGVSQLANYPNRAKKLAGIVIAPAESRKQNLLPFDRKFTVQTSLFNKQFGPGASWHDIKLWNDIEVGSSVQRWYWLIYNKQLLDGYDKDHVIDHIKQWINAFPCIAGDLTWHPYTVSERLSSFCTFYMYKASYKELIDRIHSDPQLYDFFSRSAYHLSQNLEYYPGGVTYNHVVNDLKGIITAAVVLGNEPVIAESGSLLLTELDQIIDSDGVLREGSSHYQFIVTRWLCELEFLLMESGRLDLRGKLANYNKRMLEACAFFVVYDKDDQKLKIPLIGDISPDFDPEWVLRYFSSCFQGPQTDNSYGNFILDGLGYAGLFANGMDQHGAVVKTTVDLTRVMYNDLDVFICHSRKTGVFFPGHAHDDFGSMVVFSKGKQMLGDPGRRDYEPVDSSLAYVLSDQHSVLNVNDTAVMVSELSRYYFPFYYLKRNTTISVSEEITGVTIRIATDALKRLSSARIGRYERVYSIVENLISVEDSISGRGVVTVANNIILHPECRLRQAGKNCFELFQATDNRETAWNIEEPYQIEKIFYATAYGKIHESIKVVEVHSGAVLPFYQKKEYKIV